METNTAQGTDAVVAWADARRANELVWDERAVQHEEAYGTAGFAADPAASTIGADLPTLLRFVPNGSLDGLDLIHLQCHIGTDTLSLARAGARVTGLDFSKESLVVAERLAARAGLSASWVQSDVLAARDAVEGDFDVVFTGVGALCWLADLDQWARQVAALLRPGGVFYVRDGHPMLYALDEQGQPLTVRNRYFGNGHAQAWDDEGSYLEGVRTSHTRTYEWPHALSEVIGSLLRAGLRLEHFDEHQVMDWRWAPFMEETDEGYVMPGALRDRVPLMFTVVARKPA